jgi:hypothetical protein
MASVTGTALQRCNKGVNKSSLLHPLLQRAIEIDHDVAAKDHLELVERAIAHQVVGREHHVGTQEWPHDGGVGIGGVVVGKTAQPAGCLIVAGVLLHHRERIDAIASLPEDARLQLRRVDARALVETRLVQQDGQ